MSKPSILKASDSPAASPIMNISNVVSPSPKRQLPRTASNVSTSSDDSSPVSEDLLHYECEIPAASTPKSDDENEGPPQFEFAAREDDVMGIPEDEDERAPTEHEKDMISTSIVSSANESFFSTCDNMSPNASNISYSSALETTLTEEIEDKTDPECPITSKKRQSHAFGNKPFYSADFVEVDDLAAEKLSPTEFLHSPALELSHPKPNEPSVSEIDMSNLPMPPSRPSPRKSVHWNSPNTSSRKILEEEESSTNIAHGFEMSRDSERNDGQGSSAELVAAKLAESPRMERAKQLNDTMNANLLERDMLEIEEKLVLKKACESQEIDDEMDSEDDMTLDKTVILVSSDSSSESPLKSFRMSPRKLKKVEGRTPDNVDSQTKTASPSPAKVSDLPLINLDSPQEKLQISPTFKRLTRSETAKDEELKPVILVPSLISNLNAGTSSNLGHASTSKEEKLTILRDEAGNSSQAQSAESALRKTTPRKQLKTKIDEQIELFIQTAGKSQIPHASSSKNEPAASTSTKKSDALPEDVPLSKVKKTVAERKKPESSSEAPARRPVGRPKNASKASNASVTSAGPSREQTISPESVPARELRSRSRSAVASEKVTPRTTRRSSSASQCTETRSKNKKESDSDEGPVDSGVKLRRSPRNRQATGSKKAPGRPVTITEESD